MLELKDNDFSTAGRIAEVLNLRFGAGIAQAQNGRVIQVRAPLNHNDRVAFLGQLEMLDVPSEPAVPKVVLNTRSGSIVMNQAVTLDACAVSHGDISIVVSATPLVTQQVPASVGKMMVLNAGVLLSDVVKALNGIGASPQDLLAILQSMKAAGALHAELEVI
jgi:flagellar P-ring protein precursor FlgI